jgi:hypothetical protein
MKQVFTLFSTLLLSFFVIAQNGIKVCTPTLPVTTENNSKDFAVVIGCKKYKHVKNQVAFALNDARGMNKFFLETMGIPESNIMHVENATLANLQTIFGSEGQHKGWLYNNILHDESRVFIYYCGHGAPDINEKSIVKSSYLFPCDAHPDHIATTAYSILTLQQNLKQLPAKEIVLMIDACFSGEQIITDGSPIGILPRQWSGMKNTVIISACSQSQLASWYQDKRHGLFTYFFLESLSKGDTNNDGILTYQEVFNHVADEQSGVPHFARSLKGREQTPEIRGNYKGKTLFKFKTKEKSKILKKK